MEIYVDDIVIKSKTRTEHIHHLKEAFWKMSKFYMKLNSLKCAFSIRVKKFDGFIMTQRMIEINSAQVKAMLETLTPFNKEEMWRLTGRLVSLGWFIAHFTDKLHHFFTTLHGTQMFSWTEECHGAFYAIKRYLTEPPILSSLEVGEELYMYLTVSEYVVSTVLFQHGSSNRQKSVYYASKTLVDVETRYSQVEQMALTLRIAAKKLCPYFQAHQVTILTNQPLRVTLHKPDLSKRMIKQAFELSEYNI